MRESIFIQGYDIVYLPRENVSMDYLYGEDVVSLFRDAIAIECYIKDAGGYTGNGEILTKFGIDVQDELTIQIHIDRFAEEVSNKFNNIIRPRNGDLVYFALDPHSIFEISQIDNKVPFYQAGSLYLYEINLRRFVYGAENIATGFNDIDNVTTANASIEMHLGILQSIRNQYIVGELVYQSKTALFSDSTASGSLLSQIDGIITLSKIKGKFNQGINLYGKDSGVIYTFPIKSDDTFDDTSNNTIADNINVRKEGNTTIDFSEVNPFLDNSYD